jgi:Xaa-Pro aminopeptidase
MGYILTELLLKNHFLVGSFEDVYREKLYSYFCPHSLGHSVGFDVHDPGINMIQVLI